MLLTLASSSQPSATRWPEVHISTKKKYQERLLSWTLTLAAIIGAGFSVYGIEKINTIVAAGFISLYNTLIPMLCSFFNSLESHASEGGAQESLYMKIAFARWTNTAIVICVITPFTATLNGVNLDVDNFVIVKSEVRTIISVVMSPTQLNSSTSSSQLLFQVYTVLFADVVSYPIYRILDFGGVLNKFFLAPFAKNQVRRREERSDKL